MEILSRNVDEIFTLILKEYTPETLSIFETEFASSVKRTFGELIYEVSEGLKNGYSDFEIILNENIKNMVTRMVGPQMGDLVVLMALPNLIPHVRNSYQDYKSYLEEKVSIVFFFFFFSVKFLENTGNFFFELKFLEFFFFFFFELKFFGKYRKKQKCK